MPSGMAECTTSEDFPGLRQRSASDSNILSSSGNGVPSGTSRDDYHSSSRKTGVGRFFYRLIRPWRWRRKKRSKKLEETAVSELNKTFVFLCLFLVSVKM